MTVMKGVFCPANKWTKVADATTYQGFTMTLQDTSLSAHFWVYIGASIPTQLPSEGFADGVRLFSSPDSLRGWAAGNGDLTTTDNMFVCPEESHWFNVTQF